MEQGNFHLFWNGPFSNWYSASITVDGVEYSCTEQHMMAEKAKLFEDHETLKKIMRAKHPAEQKKLGRQVKGFDVDKWSVVAKELVYKGNLAKFTQHEDLKQYLLGTGDKIIVEASPYDTVWGIGLGEDDERCLDPKQWKGTNWLGEVIMRVRATIRVGA